MKTMTADRPVTVVKQPLDEYPLAKAYGWKAAKRHNGGILYLFPPRENQQHIRLRRVESIHPDDIMVDREWLDEHFDMGPRDDD